MGRSRHRNQLAKDDHVRSVGKGLQSAITLRTSGLVSIREGVALANFKTTFDALSKTIGNVCNPINRTLELPQSSSKPEMRAIKNGRRGLMVEEASGAEAAHHHKVKHSQPEEAQRTLQRWIQLFKFAMAPLTSESSSKQSRIREARAVGGSVKLPLTK